MATEEINHEILFSGSSLELGKIHCHLLRAATELEGRWFSRYKGVSVSEESNTGKEVGYDEIRWWVFKRETDVKTLLKETNEALASVQRLKVDSFDLKRSYHTESYPELVARIKCFADLHKMEILKLSEYVKWLRAKDILAPSILFSHRVWGSTRRSDRWIEISSNEVEENPEVESLCTEFVLGLRDRMMHRIEHVYNQLASDVADSMDPEYGEVAISWTTVVSRTCYEVLDELATYFELIRQSLRNIVLEITKRDEPIQLLSKDSFWLSFVTRVMARTIEAQLWDFKESLDMWQTTGQEKSEAKVKFCRQVAAFANARGGVLIIGITNALPRKIVGIDDLENKLKFTKEVIRTHIDYYEIVRFCPLMMRNEEGIERQCLVIVIMESKDVVRVRRVDGTFSHPIRLETGIVESDYHELSRSKGSAMEDNYDFIMDLNSFLDDQ